MQPRRPTLLIVKTHALGDLLLVTPAVHRLREALPDWRIALATTAACAPLLRGNSDIDTVVTLADLRPYSALRALPALRRLSPALAIVFQASWAVHQWARMTGAVAHSLRAPHAIQWPPPFHRYTAEAYGDLVDSVMTAPPTRDLYPRLFVDETERRTARSLAGMNRYVLVAAGGGRNPRQSVDAKRWQPARFARLCDSLYACSGLPAVLVGASSDRPTVSAIAAVLRSPAHDLTGATDLRLLAGLVAEAAAVVAIDSVVLHMAIALDRPVVGLFGPTSCANFVPPGRRHQIGVSSRASCSPCYGNGIFPGCRIGHPVCMDAITVEDVFTAVRSVLE